MKEDLLLQEQAKDFLPLSNSLLYSLSLYCTPYLLHPAASGPPNHPLWAQREGERRRELFVSLVNFWTWMAAMRTCFRFFFIISSKEKQNDMMRSLMSAKIPSKKKNRCSSSFHEFNRWLGLGKPVQHVTIIFHSKTGAVWRGECDAGTGYQPAHRVNNVVSFNGERRNPALASYHYSVL